MLILYRINLQDLRFANGIFSGDAKQRMIVHSTGVHCRPKICEHCAPLHSEASISRHSRPQDKSGSGAIYFGTVDSNYT